MQKFSACRKRASSIHFFSSTSTRCIMAIWPAGPPNDRQPILAHTVKASPKVGHPLPLAGREAMGSSIWVIASAPSTNNKRGNDQKHSGDQQKNQNDLAKSRLVEVSIKLE